MDTLRLSDADREAAMDLVSEQYAVGRLTKDEFDERSDAVWSARTRGDLAPVFVDLPVRAPAGPVRPAGRPPRPGRRRPVPLAVALVALVVLTVVTHLPLVLLAVVLWCALGHRRARWHGHHPGAARQSSGSLLASRGSWS
jgi:uncharacterized membrane protein